MGWARLRWWKAWNGAVGGVLVRLLSGQGGWSLDQWGRCANLLLAEAYSCWIGQHLWRQVEVDRQRIEVAEMTEPTPVERYLLGKKAISRRDLPPDREIKPHLYEPLKDWCVDCEIVDARPRVPWRMSLHCALTDLGQMMYVELKLQANSLSEVDEFIEGDHDRLLWLIDWLVRERAKPLTETLAGEQPGHVDLDAWERYLGQERDRFFQDHFARLEDLLSRGGSAWRVGVDPAGLFERVTDSEWKVFEEATSEQDAATEHLDAAWEAAWRVDPNGQVAFDEAVKAVEAALRPVVTPNDSAAHLGRIRGELKVSQEHYTSRLERTLEGSKRQPATPFANEGVQMIYELTGSLWRSHRRHGDPERRVPHGVEEGRDAVTLATALIAMQRRGFLERTAKGR